MKEQRTRSLAIRWALILIWCSAARPAPAADPEPDRDLKDLNVEVVKKWQKFAEKMLQQQNPRLALRAVEIIEAVDPLNKDVAKLREDPRILLQAVRRHAVLLLSLDREKGVPKAKDLARDRSGTGNDGTIRGARFDLGVAGDCLTFEGAKDSVQSALASQRFPQKDSPWTMCVWIKASTPGGSIFRLSGEDGTATLLSLLLGPEGQLVVDGGGRGKVSGKRSLCDGQWHHAAAVFSPGGAEPLEIYLDGEKDASGPFQLSSKENGRLGWQLGAAGSGPPLRGQIDEVGLFLRSLTAGEIQALYRLGKSGKSLGD